MAVPRFMPKRRRSRLTLWTALWITLPVLPVCATPWSADAGPPHLDRPWRLDAYLGQHNDARFVEITTFRDTDLQNSYLAGLALGRRLATTFDYLHLEIEASGYRHWGMMDHWEANAAVVARWDRFPWDRYVYTSIAFAQGVSWASERPAVEGDTRQFLNHLFAELEAGPPGSRWSGVVRVHHRSGVFGLYGVRGGSNFLNVGVRYRF